MSYNSGKVSSGKGKSVWPLCDSRGGGRGGGGEKSGGWSSSFESSRHESFRGRKAWNTSFCKTTSVTFTGDRPAQTSRPWYTWHLRWWRGRRTEADLLSESGPYDNAASPAALRRSALKTGLCGGTSTHIRPRWGTWIFSFRRLKRLEEPWTNQ